MLDNFYSTLRKLAKSNRFQTLYSIEKPIGIRLFQNQTDLTPLQITFLNYLNMYNVLNTDIYMDEVNEVVLKDEVYEDAYFVYKNKKKKDEKKVAKKDKQVSKKGETVKETQEMKSQWIFRKPRKK
jgi:hypothetical protein